ncbi:MAG: transcription termination/antitermination protein NusA [Dehalococcoidales bacterium]|nr:transcription termination/antitermination protein NusA [Dehalococcoidales bacterium]
MKSEFLLAITQLSAEKNLPKEVVISAVESALVSAYRKDSFTPNQNIDVKINRTTGRVEVWAEKSVVKKPEDTRQEISLAEARRIKEDAQLGELIMVESTPQNAGRIAAQTAKQVILQRLHEAEHSAIFEEYAGKSGDIVSGVIQRIEPRQVLIDLGRVEAVLPSNEQMPNERYRVGQRLKVYMVEVAKTPRGPRVIVSRSHPDLLKRLFELEVPEVSSGTVEIKAVAREAGYRSKVAVAARQQGIDPVGCCVGLRGIRIQNIVSELSGEKIDVVLWNPDPAVFIASALSPAQIVAVELNKTDGNATVVVPDRQLSLAIGKEGQNARLAAKLSNWRIDIKPASVYEAEKAAQPASETEGAEEEVVGEKDLRARRVLAGAPVGSEPPVIIDEEEAKEEKPEPELEETAVGRPVHFETQATPTKAELRFAEDILGPKASQSDSKAKKKKKGQSKKEEETVKGRKPRRQEIVVEDEEEY